MAHTAILSKGYGFQGDGEIRDEAVPAGNAVDVHDDPLLRPPVCVGSDFRLQHASADHPGKYPAGLHMDVHCFRSGAASSPVAATSALVILISNKIAKLNTMRYNTL